MKDFFKDLFIFEMANNHQGSVEHGFKIIDAMAKIARKHGIKAGVKLQYRDMDTFIHPGYKERKDIKHIPRFMETRLSRSEYQSLVSAVRDRGMITICTPFDEVSAGVAADHGIEILKIASCSANDWPLLDAIVKLKKPIICSTGGQTIHSIDNIVSFFDHREADYALLHCVGIYPTPDRIVQMSFIDRMKKRYPYVPVGYSGHESPDNLDVVKIAVAKGSVIFERHVGLPAETITLNAYSMNPQQVDAWVASALKAKEMCTGYEKQITQEEMDSLLSLARGVYAVKNIKKGDVIGRDSVFFAMPCHEGQTSSGEYQESMISSREYVREEPIKEKRKATVISTIRNIMHDVKGMLYEANIEIGRDFEIELSHHYGIEHFRQTGALIINLINREYCKKLVVLLPGQQHPDHYHKVKEETFQLLWGDLEINLEGKIMQMKRGQKVLVERGTPHSFGSRYGAIFEEVSTTHIKGDSYYNEERISKMDPIERKTIIENW